MVVVVILAGGMGKRMNSEIPKVLHTINNEPMLVKIVNQVLLIKPEKIFIVVSYFENIIKDTLKQHNLDISMIRYIQQYVPKGTGHALLSCVAQLKHFDDQSSVLVLNGDTPLISSNSLTELNNFSNNVVIGVTELSKPYGYGRIVENDKGEFVRIVEEKDCTDKEKQIKKVNCGIYSIKNILIQKYVNYVGKENAQHEYYITDLIKILKDYLEEKLNERFLKKI